MTHWAKSHTLAEQFTRGDMSFTSLVETLSRAIAYGRRQERAAGLQRLTAAYAQSDGFENGALASGEILNLCREALRSPALLATDEQPGCQQSLRPHR